MRTASGMTLVEVMVAMLITVVAIAASLSIAMFGSEEMRESEAVADSNSYARMAGDAIASTLRNAGVGAGQGVYLGAGGVPALVNAIWGADNLLTNQAGNNPLKSDDLWIITSDKTALRDNCNTRGAYTQLVAGGTGLLQVRPVVAPCTSSFKTKENLLVSNLNTAALLTNIQVLGAQSNQINYNESGIAGFSNAPQKGGFQVGDFVYRAQVFHYYLDKDPIPQLDLNGNPVNGLALYRAQGTVGTDFKGRPLVDAFVGDATQTPTLVQRYIEDFQVVYWMDPNLTNDPSKYVDQHGLDPPFISGIRGVTVYIVSKSRQVLLDSNNRAILTTSTMPKSIANHNLIGPLPDGYRRSVYSRRVELPNLMTSNL